jgi:hypothetical protein
MTGRAVLVVAGVAACGGAPTPGGLYPAGSPRDDGYGELAQASTQLSLGDDGGLPPLARRARRGGAYGGAVYGDDQDTDNPLERPERCHGRRCRAVPATPRYKATVGLTGVIEGSVRWRGEPARLPITGCGALTPTARPAAATALIYIDHVEVGRELPNLERPVRVGGVVAKRGCALTPTLQILTPLPAELTIEGDATPAHLLVVAPTASEPLELPEAGRAVVAAQPGVTRIEADDGSLAAAWILATDSPYYALTDDHGRFRIDELAAGTYDVAVVRAPRPVNRAGKLVYGDLVTIHRTVKVDAARPARLDVTLDP